MVQIGKTKISGYLQLLAGIIPLSLSIAFVLRKSIVLLIVMIASMFLVIAVMPICRKMENMWMFLLVAMVGIPINIFVIYYIILSDFLGIDFFIGKLLWSTLLYCIFFSIEQIIFGVLARIIWKKQRKIKL
ncbi:MAG: hypothetical protein NC185_06300 [Ruminococcus sp.]|nr:hypothetical protein [Ruminococcus sp.]